MAGAATFAARLYCWLWMGVAAHVPVMVRGRSVLVAALVATRWCGASAVVVAGRRVGGSGGGFLLVKISRNSTKDRDHHNRHLHHHQCRRQRHQDKHHENPKFKPQLHCRNLSKTQTKIKHK